MRKLSYADLTVERDRLAIREHILSVAYTDMADSVYRHRDGRDSYVWKAYRLTGHAGGYVIGVFHGFTNGRPAILYVERLDTVLQQVRERSSSFMECGMCHAVERFARERYNALQLAG